MTEWAWNDGWILMSLFLAQGESGAELDMLIATADATNHAIPAAKELSTTFTKLARCGVLSVDQGRYTIAPEFLPGIRKAYDGRGGLFATGDKGVRWLKRFAVIEGTNQRINVTEAKAKSAYNRYIKMLQTK